MDVFLVVTLHEEEREVGCVS